MGVKTIPAVEARIHLGDIIKRAFQKGERFIVEKSGLPMVAIMNIQEYLKLVQEREERFKILDQTLKIIELDRSKIRYIDLRFDDVVIGPR